jgi:hypothetical protein
MRDRGVSIEVEDCFGHQGGVVSKAAKATIAVLAEEPTHLTSCMIVVYVKPVFSRLSATNTAATSLPLQHCFVVCAGDSIGLLQPAICFAGITPGISTILMALGPVEGL